MPDTKNIDEGVLEVRRGDVLKQMVRYRALSSYYFLGASITSQPIYGRKASGTITLPSAC